MSVSKYAEQINNLCAKMQRDFENMLKKYESKLIEYDKNITELQKLQESFAEIRACLETHLSIMKRFNSMLAMAI